MIVNPLAILLHESKEILKFYDTNGTSIDAKRDDRKEIYVLNVNFAGNESHESAIRVRLLAKPSDLSAITKTVASGKLSEDHVHRHRALIDCLQYYGYLLILE
jgi:hypothetical protein